MSKEKRTPSEADTSSIGPTYPPQESSFGRIKGFETRHMVTSRKQIEEYARMIEQKIPELNGSLSRISFRFLASNEAVESSLDLLEQYGEVILPLEGAGDGLDTMNMVYIGYNLPGVRDIDADDLKQEKDNIHVALQTPRKDFQEIISRVTEQGYTLETPDFQQRKHDTQLRDQIAALYSRFGWNYEEAMSILEKPENIFAIARRDGNIVSAALAERATINIQKTVLQKQNLRIAELTEAATLNEHQGKGLYTAIAAQLLGAIAQLPPEEKLHLVLGEGNGLALGVLKAIKRLGRTFASEVAQERHWPIGGYLPQHVPIEGVSRKTAYNDLFPAFISAADIQKLYGQVPAESPTHPL